MKKVITLCLFVFAMFLGNQSLVAQNSKLEIKKEINAEASSKTEALRKYVKFSNDQRDQMYLALQEYGQGKKSLTNKEAILKIEKRLDDKVKTILSEEQYANYLAYIEEN